VTPANHREAEHKLLVIVEKSLDYEGKWLASTSVELPLWTVITINSYRDTV